MKRKPLVGYMVAFGMSALAVLAGCASGKTEDSPHPETAPFTSEVVANPAPVAVEVATDLTEANNLGRGASSTDPIRIVEGGRPPNVEKIAEKEEPSKSEETPKSEVAAVPAPTTTPVAPKEEVSRTEREIASTTDPERVVTHVVKDGDTLMKLAFEYLGDLLRWREIYGDNKDKIFNVNSLKKGTALKIHVTRPVKVSKNGEAYDIRRGDTLGKISNLIYGTFAQWRRLWENNRELIRDPNRIYAGFRLYYTMTGEERALSKNGKPLAKVAPLVPTSGSKPIPVPVEDSRSPASDSPATAR